MKFRKLMLLLALSASVLAFSGCQSSRNTAGESVSSESETSQPGSGLESTVTLDKTYWAGNNIRVRMRFDTDGNCRYGYVGVYDLETTEEGYHVLTLVYYADEDAGQMASTSYALRDNGDGTYSKAIYTEGEEPDFDNKSATILTYEEGNDSVMDDSVFDGIYLSSDGQYYTFNSDGSFAMEIWMKYIADDTSIELIGADNSTLYTYNAEDDFNRLTLYRDGEVVMELSTEESSDAASSAGAE